MIPLNIRNYRYKIDSSKAVSLEYLRDGFLLKLWLLFHIFRVLGIVLKKCTRSLSLQDLRLDYERRMKHRSLRLAVVVTDSMVAARSFIPALAFLIDLRFTVIHGVKHLAIDDVADHVGAPMTMRCRRSIRRIFDEETGDGEIGSVSQLVSESGSHFAGWTTRTVQYLGRA